MKQFIFLLFAPVLAVQVFAQDVIVKNDKTEIRSKVTELTDNEIKYKKFEHLDGPVYSLHKKEVFMIIYENGTKEYISEKQSAPLSLNEKQDTYAKETNEVNTADSSDAKKVDNWVNSMAFNDKFSSIDYEFSKKCTITSTSV